MTKTIFTIIISSTLLSLFFVASSSGYDETKNNGETIVYPIYIGKTKEMIPFIASRTSIEEPKSNYVEIIPEISPLEKLIKESELIVVGEVVSDKIGINIGKSHDSSYFFSESTIEASSVLKGDKNIKKIVLAMPAFLTTGNDWQKWESPIFKTGANGIWFLTKHPNQTPDYVVKIARQKGDYYFADTAERRKNLNDDLVKKIITLTN